MIDMPTKIGWKTYESYNLLGFCADDPVTVLRRLDCLYPIGVYKNVSFPLNPRSLDCFFYVITEADQHDFKNVIPKGCSITGSIDDLMPKLEAGVIHPRQWFPRTRKEFLGSINYMIDSCLDGRLSGSFNEEESSIVHSILEVVSIYLKIEHPTIDDLKTIHRKIRR
jgi:hypothetical protein